MRRLFVCLVLLVPVFSIVGCSDSKPVVVEDSRSEEEKQQELIDYDKQMAEDAANYEKQQSGS